MFPLTTEQFCAVATESLKTWIRLVPPRFRARALRALSVELLALMRSEPSSAASQELPAVKDLDER